jgi:microtubule-associated protein-like 6
MDARIYVYTIKGNSYIQHAMCCGHSGGVRALDFTLDSLLIQSNCTAGELLYWSVKSCEQVNLSPLARNPKWATWSCIYGWPVQGLHKGNVNDDNYITVELSKDGDTLALSDVFGGIKLTRFPLINHTFSDKYFIGHAGAVSRVAFTANDRYVISTGREDYCVFQWKLEAEMKEQTDIKELPVDKFDKNILESESKKMNDKGNAFNAIAAGAVQEDAAKAFVIDGGDEFMAVKPYLGAIHEPTRYKDKKISDSVPDTSLTLDWVYGFSAQDSRNNIYFSNNGEVVFFAAGTAVAYDIQSDTQKFNRDHTDDIISIAAHPNGKIFATGEVGKKPKIIVWDVDTMFTLEILVGFHERGV